MDTISNKTSCGELCLRRKTRHNVANKMKLSVNKSTWREGRMSIHHFLLLELDDKTIHPAKTPMLLKNFMEIV